MQWKLIQSIVIHFVPNKGLTASELEQNMDVVVKSRSKDVSLDVEFVEETPKELKGATFLH